VLTAVRQGDWIELDFPATPDEAAEPPAGLAQALGAAALYVGRSRFDYLVELDDEETVRSLRPDFGLLAAIEARGVIATSRSADPGFDFVSRFFAPASGINEDPVTGSSHCCLGPFWGRRLRKESLLARQVSARGGVLKVRLERDRVVLGGQAVTVLRSELLAGMESGSPRVR
jgi:predicted PhzF superfamily epimerase YddE/YHI9